MPRGERIGEERGYCMPEGAPDQRESRTEYGARGGSPRVLC